VPSADVAVEPEVGVAAATAEVETGVATTGGGSVCVWEMDTVLVTGALFTAALSLGVPMISVTMVAWIFVILVAGSGLGSRFTYFS